MSKGSTWIRLGVILTFVIALVCCAVLGIQVLHSDTSVKAGIATLKVVTVILFLCDHFWLIISQLQFNFTEIHLPLLTRRSKRDVLQPLQSEALSAANVVATAISPAMSKDQNAASAATDIPDINTIREMIPRNCSLGTKQFCVGFDNHTECNNLPLNLSKIVSEAVTPFVGDQVYALQPLPGTLIKVTVAYIQACLILGLVLMLVMTIILGFILGFANYLLRLSIRIGMVIIFMGGLICCILFAIPTGVLYAVQSKIDNLPSSIQVQKGNASNYCLGVLCFGVVMTLLATLSPILV